MCFHCVLLSVYIALLIFTITLLERPIILLHQKEVLELSDCKFKVLRLTYPLGVVVSVSAKTSLCSVKENLLMGINKLSRPKFLGDFS